MGNKVTPTVIVDIDGTMANIEHRLPLIRKGGHTDWERFQRECIDDEPIVDTIKIVQCLRTWFIVTLVTGRMEFVRPQTKEWLEKHSVPYDNLFMRSDGDTRPDFEVKKDILEQDIIPIFGKENIMCAIDDRQQVVDMWRREGIMCWQVADGDY